MNKITYLVANYNNGRYIKECIESLNTQTSEDWLCIICDDASTDDSLTVINNLLSDRISMIQNKCNQGYIFSLKKLIDASTTDIVGVIDPDDAIEPNTTTEVLSVYNKNKSFGFVYTDFKGYEDDFERDPCILTRCRNKPKGKTSLVYGFVSSLKTFRRSLYYQTPQLDEKIRYAEDRDLCYMMEEVTDFYFINKPLYKYRLHAGSQTTGFKEWIGYFNHVRARAKTLKRRNIKGFGYLIHSIISFCFLFPRLTFVRKYIVKILIIKDSPYGNLPTWLNK